MGEDIDSNEPVAEHDLTPQEQRLINDFQLVLSELLSQAANNPEGLSGRISGFTQTFLEQYGQVLSEDQQSELFELRDRLLKQEPRS